MTEMDENSEPREMYELLDALCDGLLSCTQSVVEQEAHER